MKAAWRKHLIICLLLGLLAIPIYFLDRALLGSGGGGNCEQTDASDSSTTIFESTNGPESQRQVRSGEVFTYAFPLKFLAVCRANEVRITLYLFKAPSGPTAGDIAKVFINSPQRDDDGEYFYGVLPPPSQPAN
jgi:hypothetical protein